MSYEQSNTDRDRNLDPEYNRGQGQGQQFDTPTDQGSNTGSESNPAGGARGRTTEEGEGDYGSNVADSGPDTGRYGNMSGSGYEQRPTGEEGAQGRGSEPGMGDKIRGGTEKLVGKVTGRSDWVERGQERKSGEPGA